VELGGRVYSKPGLGVDAMDGVAKLTARVALA
jgi:hypothetical protein